MKTQRNVLQKKKKEQDKSPETDLNKTGISHLSDRGFKISVINVLPELRRANHE